MTAPVCLADLWSTPDPAAELGLARATATGDGLAVLAPGVAEKFEVAVELVERWGVGVIRLDGYEDRGRQSTFNPQGGVDHHTGGPAWSTPSQWWTMTYLCRDGRSDLNGPLSNVVTWPDGTLVVVARGTCNHAGSGGWRGLAGNYSVFGNEQVHSGGPNEPWPAAQLYTSILWNAACCSAFKLDPADYCEHKEWSDAGKIDRIGLSGGERRATLAALLAGGVSEPRRRNLAALIAAIS